ncbi:PQQ-binding-like beta-propeller repeat protein [Flavobacterium sp. PL002]|uniref:outer membrane protein assembly factor BamB family protein n=1 Tax=Flavobacterium sp. PL002 TaxID=1897058 RepID=UPI001787FDC8|nr:PQQ-binding-like beta-propeller repeat protein [Flavobacterium sp. PL002]MBE0391826.1 Outer membrane protein assembly factor BamB [Flavobacterium sp. PL002]
MVKYIFILASICLLSCKNKEQEPIKKTLFLTTNANDVYAFDIDQKKLKWHHPGFNLEVNDEVNYFTLDNNIMTKIYQDGIINRFDKNTGKILWQIQDKPDESQSYYGYDFDDVRFLQFYQYPLVHEGNIIFGNSHGEIKSINIESKKTNWVYIQPQIIYSSPKIIKNILYVNVNHSLIMLDLKTGKKVGNVKYADNEHVLNEIKVEDGVIYTLSQNNLLSARAINFEEKFHYKADENLHQSSTFNMVFDEDNVYFGGNILYAIDKKNGELSWKTTLNEDENGSEILSVAIVNNGVIVLTKKELLKLDDEGGIIARIKPKAQPIGLLYPCNGLHYYLAMDGNLYRIDEQLKNEELFFKGINLDPEHRVDNSYMMAQ